MRKFFLIALGTVFITAVLYAILTTDEKKEPGLYNFDTGKASTYKLNFSQRSKLAKSELMPQEIYYNFVVDALLHIKVLKDTGEEFWSAYQLSNVELSGADNIFLDNVKPYYESMFLVKHDRYGKILDIHFNGLEKNFSGLAQLVYMLEVINLDKKAYKLYQDDQTGRYNVFYMKKSENIQKQKSKYIDVKNPSDLYSVKVKKYILNAGVDLEGNWLKDYSLEEELELYDEDKKLFATNKNSVVLKKISKNAEFPSSIKSDEIDSYIKNFKEKKDSDVNVFQKIEDINIKNDFSKHNTTLKELTGKIKTSNDLLQIQDYLRVFPDETYKLKELLLSVDDTTNMRLIAMLPNVRTPQSQELLADIAQSYDAKRMTKIRSIVALGSVDKVSAKTVDALKMISDTKNSDLDKELSDTSLLALSSHGDKEDFKDDIVSFIRSEYIEADTSSKEKNVLFAMQNAGAENFLDEIGESLNSRSKKVRKVAIQSLATIEDVTIRKEMLQKHLNIENDEGLKKYINELLLGL